MKKGKEGKLLNDAEFIIKNSTGKYVIKATNGAITFGDKSDATVLKSDATGKFEVKGLPYATYTLVETKAPDGYALPTNPETSFIVSPDSYYLEPEKIETGTVASDNEQDVLNKKVTIPQTGGIGTMAFTIIGAALILFSIVFYKKSSKA